MGRKKKAQRNLIISLILEIINIFSGLVLPRLIIGVYGSPTNGLVNSIASFIGYVALLQSGVGSVIKAALYKPLACGDKKKVNDIVLTLQHFYKRIVLISVIYVILLAFIFPLNVSGEFDYTFTFSLILIISLSTLAQYLWGMPYQVLLEADQKGYIYSLVQGGAVLLNTVFSIILINKGCSIQVVKLVTAAIYVIRPLIIRQYAIIKYDLNKYGTIDYVLLKSRWDGFAQAIAFYIHSKTDIFVLTIFSTLSNVSVYSIYALIIAAVSTLIKALDQAVSPAFGNIIARKEEILNDRFDKYCNLMHNLSAILFGTACITITNFIRVYTHNITDYNYIRVLFGTLIITAEFVYCLRLPYNCIVYAAGKIKETKNSAIWEAIINIVLSILFVKKMGLTGVALATLIAMAYRTLSLIMFLEKNVLFLNAKKEVRRITIAAVEYIPSIVLMICIEQWGFVCNTFMSWILFAIIVVLIYTLYVILINIIINRKEFKGTISFLLRR